MVLFKSAKIMQKKKKKSPNPQVSMTEATPLERDLGKYTPVPKISQLFSKRWTLFL